MLCSDWSKYFCGDDLALSAATTAVCGGHGTGAGLTDIHYIIGHGHSLLMVSALT